MMLPAQVELPFFTYGLFRPGQIGFGQLRKFVEKYEAGWYTKGHLFDRDGLPVLDQGEDKIEGVIIWFREEDDKAAYEVVARKAKRGQVKFFHFPHAERGRQVFASFWRPP